MKPQVNRLLLNLKDTAVVLLNIISILHAVCFESTIPFMFKSLALGSVDVTLGEKEVHLTRIDRMFDWFYASCRVSAGIEFAALQAKYGYQVAAINSRSSCQSGILLPPSVLD